MRVRPLMRKSRDGLPLSALLEHSEALAVHEYRLGNLEVEMAAIRLHLQARPPSPGSLAPTESPSGRWVNLLLALLRLWPYLAYLPLAVYMARMSLWPWLRSLLL